MRLEEGRRCCGSGAGGGKKMSKPHLVDSNSKTLRLGNLFVVVRWGILKLTLLLSLRVCRLGKGCGA